MTPDWPALRRLLWPCAIGVGIWTAFLAFWQLAVPGDEPSSSLSFWLLFAALALLFPTSLVLAAAATHRFWRARRRFVALLPGTLLFASAFALPVLAGSAGLGPLIAVWTVPCALLLSGVASASFVVYTPSPAPPPPSDHGMDGWTKAV
jgi:hypothetical protein